MRRGTQGHVAELCEPTRRVGGAQEAHTCGRGHASPRGRQRGCHVASDRLVGPGERLLGR